MFPGRLQVLYFIPGMRAALLATMPDPEREFSLLDELALLFRMLASESGHACQATNLLRALRQSREATGLGLLEGHAQKGAHGADIEVRAAAPCAPPQCSSASIPINASIATAGCCRWRPTRTAPSPGASRACSGSCWTSCTMRSWPASRSLLLCLISQPWRAPVRPAVDWAHQKPPRARRHLLLRKKIGQAAMPQRNLVCFATLSCLLQ